LVHLPIQQPEYVYKNVLEQKDCLLTQVINNVYLNVLLDIMVIHYNGFVYKVVRIQLLVIDLTLEDFAYNNALRHILLLFQQGIVFKIAEKVCMVIQ
jgi:hypothetical protein